MQQIFSSYAPALVIAHQTNIVAVQKRGHERVGGRAGQRAPRGGAGSRSAVGVVVGRRRRPPRPLRRSASMSRYVAKRLVSEHRAPHPEHDHHLPPDAGDPGRPDDHEARRLDQGGRRGDARRRSGASSGSTSRSRSSTSTWVSGIAPRRLRHLLLQPVLGHDADRAARRRDAPARADGDDHRPRDRGAGLGRRRDLAEPLSSTACSPAFAAVGIAIPTFVIGIAPDHRDRRRARRRCRPRGTSPSSATRSSSVKSTLLPAITLGIGVAAVTMRILRAVARRRRLAPRSSARREGKGLLRSQVVVRHELPNASIPAITQAGIIVAHLVGGAVIVEYVFARPGLGHAARRLGLPARLRRPADARPARRRRLHRHEPGRRRRSSASSTRGCATKAVS